MQCQKKKRDGNQCRARARSGQKYCACTRNQARPQSLVARVAAGVPSTPDALQEFTAPKTAADLRDLLAQSIIEIRAGKLDPKLANSISYLGTGFLRAIEVADIQARLESLEREHREAW